MKTTKRLIASLIALAAPMALPQMAFAQQTTAAPADDGAIVVLGTRRQDRSVLDSAVAIDVISAETLETTGYADLNDSLRTLVPSFNAQRLPLNDGSSFVRPITLRSSPADHVLLLMNGHRRHRSAIVQIGTGHATTSGSQGQDFNVIPGIAVSSIEVLRDGAAAQYGSDAIAGVVNFSLSRADSGGAISGHYGMAARAMGKRSISKAISACADGCGLEPQPNTPIRKTPAAAACGRGSLAHGGRSGVPNIRPNWASPPTKR